ncbi:hypothetical protein chiPu_0031676 [Chiloscyllium punctatum]|uniref:Uncharacterized protein n=1 Tax=Chiloscyllium punctatum TaxID=137246 RepID=A0A401TXV5_CHIPU|nr:hypothetical protein [Chiloscyllium punctatum]
MAKPTHFTVHTKGAGKARPSVQFTGPSKAEAVRDFEILDNHDDTYTVRYTPVQQLEPFGSKESLSFSALKPSMDPESAADSQKIILTMS